MVAVTGMLAGTNPPQSRRRKFTPLQLLVFRRPLFNPDPWLNRHINKLDWLWSKPIAILLSAFLLASLLVGASESSTILVTGQKLWAYYGWSLLLPLGLLSGLVIALHELAHAFTLKHYGGIVPEIGLLIICLMPGCYTNTTDSYCLTRRSQRALVVGAGVLCQLTLWAIALWFWLVLISWHLVEHHQLPADGCRLADGGNQPESPGKV
jgi:putative peptide zinc metalloprotease protein